jgi:hypothetical protein
MTNESKDTLAQSVENWRRAFASLPSAAEVAAHWQSIIATLPSAEDAARGMARIAGKKGP